MSSCPRCFALIDGGSTYCGVCGRPRIAEGLRAAVVRPAWFHPAMQALAGVVALWLLVTIGVAFLREARAVRLSRKLLEEGRAPDAWSLLMPFLPDHPTHRQALFLCGKATIRLGIERRAEAKQCLERLKEQSPELSKELEGDYSKTLTQQARELGCDVRRFEQLLASAEEIGPPYEESVLDGLDGIVDACRTVHDESTPWNLAQVLAKKNQSASLAEKGYVPAINGALAVGRYADAKALAQQAVRVVPAGAATVEAALDGERNKVSKTVETISQLCTSLRADARYHPGNTWCFPATPPTTVQSAKDGWGRAVAYSPLAPDSSQTCYQSFMLTSLGGDGIPTKGDSRSPAAEIVCRFGSGGESWQTPNEYWQISQGG
jgi:tetratricopeptide (TPR) repeat protein